MFNTKNRAMKYAWVLVFLTITNFSFCQLVNNPPRQIAIINSTFGKHSVMRAGKSADSKVIDTIYENEFFHAVQDSTSIWWEVFYAGKVGYLDKSGIKFIDSMDYLLAKKMISDIFVTQKELLLQMYLMIYHYEHHS